MLAGVRGVLGVGGCLLRAWVWSHDERVLGVLFLLFAIVLVLAVLYLYYILRFCDLFQGSVFL